MTTTMLIVAAGILVSYYVLSTVFSVVTKISFYLSVAMTLGTYLFHLL